VQPLPKWICRHRRVHVEAAPAQNSIELQHSAATRSRPRCTVRHHAGLQRAGLRV
jgi:hypothetical protein